MMDNNNNLSFVPEGSWEASDLWGASWAGGAEETNLDGGGGGLSGGASAVGTSGTEDPLQPDFDFNAVSSSSRESRLTSVIERKKLT